MADDRTENARLDDEHERFITRGEDVEILSEPQCVGCIHNQGMLKCAALATKPTEYLTNAMDCPMRETE